MARASKIFTIIMLSLYSFIFLIIYFPPRNQNYDDLISLFKSTSSAAPNIKDKKGDANLERIEAQLARARRKIRKAIDQRSFTSNGSFIPQGTVYRNPYAFLQSHIEMMKTFKIWVYKEGELPLVHCGPMNHIYAIEGQFIEEIERGENIMVASNPDEAHAFFIPISITYIVYYLYKPGEVNFFQRMRDIVDDYVDIIANKYPYWNRTDGADHFLVSCHDWAPFVSSNSKFYKKMIRVLCNANTSEGFIPNRDVSMSEIYGPYYNIPHVSTGLSPYNRSILAFFAGGNHGIIRTKLLQYWEHKKDNDIQVFERLPKSQNYTAFMSRSKFCLCPSGYQVASARITEAIHVGCVPVIIKEHYVVPYNDVLDWSQFSVQVKVDQIPDLKGILQAIPFPKYIEMQRTVMTIQSHFKVNIPAKQFDVFHMIVHSLWLRRLDMQLTMK